MFFTHIFQVLSEREENTASNKHNVRKDKISDARTTSSQLPLKTNFSAMETFTTNYDYVHSSPDPRFNLPVGEIPPRAPSKKPSPAPRLYAKTPERKQLNRKTINSASVRYECVAPSTITATPALPPITNSKISQRLSTTTDTQFSNINNGWSVSTRLPPIQSTSLTEVSLGKQCETKHITKARGQKLGRRKASYALPQGSAIEGSQPKDSEQQGSNWYSFDTDNCRKNTSDFVDQSENSICHSRFNNPRNFPKTVQLQEFEEVFLQTEEENLRSAENARKEHFRKN